MIEAINIHKTYDGQGTGAQALRGASMSVGQGEFLCLVGRSGSGKSTMLSVLSTLLVPDSGRILYKGADLADLSGREINRLRHSDFSVIFQFHHLMAYMTAEENVLLPFLNAYKPVTQDVRAKARESLERVGLGGKHKRLPGELSGGEQQRVAIARALAKDSRVLFADEPTGSLDRETGRSVMDLLADLNNDGLTVVMVTHDREYASRAGRVLTMVDGRVLLDSPPDALIEQAEVAAR